MSGPFAVTQRILLKLEFCGSHFCGWQLQSEVVELKSKRSLQFHLESAVATALGRNGERYIVHGCGRTDSGVHAVDYYCHFDVHEALESKVANLQKFAHSLNGILPAGITVLEAKRVDLDFHALKSATLKVYEYRVFLRNQRPTVYSDFLYWLRSTLDSTTDKKGFDYLNFCKAAKMFVGTHNFFALASHGSKVKSTIRTIYRIEVIREKFPTVESSGDLLRIRFFGNGFLKQMVRNMVGTMLEVGLGKRESSSILQLLDGNTEGVRSDAGVCVPAQGLFLMKVLYTPIDEFFKFYKMPHSDAQRSSEVFE